MSTLRSHLDEFESVFKQSVRQHVKIEPLEFERLLVILDSEGCDVKREAIVSCAAEMVDRFRVGARVVAPVPRLKRATSTDTSRAEKLLQETLKRLEDTGARDVTGTCSAGSPAQIILEEIASYQPSMVLMSSLFGEDDDDLETYTLGSVADRVLSTVRQPILLVEGEVPDVAGMWRDFLVYVEDRETASCCLSATLTLAEKGAAVALLHVLDEEWLATLQRGLELASEVDTQIAADAIAASLRKDIEHFLTGAGEALTLTGHVVSTHFEIGDPIELTRDRILAGNHRLLVCNSVAPDQKLIDSVAYNLAAYLREIPLLLV